MYDIWANWGSAGASSEPANVDRTGAVESEPPVMLLCICSAQPKRPPVLLVALEDLCRCCAAATCIPNTAYMGTLEAQETACMLVHCLQVQSVEAAETVLCRSLILLACCSIHSQH